MRRVYLDNNATTPVDPEVLKAMLPLFCENFGNAASIHDMGQKARALVEEARQDVAELLGARTSEVVFTCGGTESDNAAVCGVARYHREKGRHLITSTIEHPAVLRSMEQLEREGFEVTYLPVGPEGLVQADQLEKAIRDDTILVSVMYANNEVGTIQPLRELSKLTAERGILFHSDAVQAVGKIPLDVHDLQVDLLSLSAHKFHGPKGVGALFVRDGTQLEPLLLGGSHERRRRAGTENVPGIVGLGRACQIAGSKLEDYVKRIGSLRDRFEQHILERVPDCVPNGSKDHRLAHVANISFKGVEGEALLIALDFDGIEVSTGAACSSGSLKPSHVLTAMHLPRDLVQSAIRFSFGRMNVDEDVDYCLDRLPKILNRMRQMAPHSYHS